MNLETSTAIASGTTSTVSSEVGASVGADLGGQVAAHVAAHVAAQVGVSVEPTSTQHLEWRTTFRAGLFTWPSLRREIEHACVAAGIKRRHVKARWRGFGVNVDIVLAGDEKSVRRMARFINDLAAQA